MKCESVSPLFTPQTKLQTKAEISQTIPLGRRLKGAVGRTKAAIANWIVQTSEPKVSHKRDRQGHLYYQVYDPLSGVSASFGSEAEIRAWLEQRYYR
ncbi:hypothetical protein [Altericista sp. CCNU0014]|uniref:hypothetical protein n=1 Tax=Altericista sp. CCNU0014 TaxID=3082949 RepID=UPI00384C53E9